jgi:DNA-binding beta-propeller fold protein YncE
MPRHLIFLCFPVLAAAQGLTPRMTVPALGYFFDDNAKAIRLISGVPGAAALDTPVALDYALDFAFVDSRSRVAVANTKDGAIALLDWNGAPKTTLLETQLGRLQYAAFSRSGAAISDGTRIEVWSGLRGTPARTAALSPDGGVAGLALNDEGALAAVTRGGAAVLLNGEARTIGSGIAPSGIAFLPNGNDMLAVDAGARNLLLIRDVRSSPASTVIAALDQDPGAVAVSYDGAMAALAAGGDVVTVNLTDGASRVIGCGCRVSAFNRLAGNLVFHAEDIRTGATLIVNAGTLEPQVARVPEIGGAPLQ